MSDNTDGRCRVCEKKHKHPSRELVTVGIDNDEVLVCYPCRKELVEGIRFLFNGLRKIRGQEPYKFTPIRTGGVPR